MLHLLDIWFENFFYSERSLYAEDQRKTMRLDMPVLTWGVAVLDSVLLGWLPLLLTWMLCFTVLAFPILPHDAVASGLQWLAPSAWFMVLVNTPLGLGRALLGLVSVFTAAQTWLGNEGARRRLLALVDLMAVFDAVALCWLMGSLTDPSVIARVLLSVALIALNRWCFNHPSVRAYYA